MNTISMTIEVTPQQAQYIAALVELWDQECDIEVMYAIRQLPGLIRDIALEFEGVADFVDRFDEYAEYAEWNERDKDIIRLIFSIASNKMDVERAA